MTGCRLNRFLQGVKVVDLSRYIPGPMASLLFADMGAEVIKVEPPAGDDMRSLGPRGPAGEPLFHHAINAGKTLRRLDLKREEDRAGLLTLLDHADILIEGFRPGVMARLGLDHAALRERNPRLITCAISGYGAEGPCAQMVGHDGNYLAGAGMMHRNGVPPRFFDPPIVDLAGSLFAAVALLGALQARERDGKGCHIDLGLADVPMALQLFEVAAISVTGTISQPNETYLNGGAAYYQVYATADRRYVMVGAVEAKFWRNFAEAAGHPEWSARQAEPLPQRALMADVSACLGEMTLAECATHFGQSDCCVTRVLDLGEAMASPHYRARQLLTRSGAGIQALFPAWVDGSPPHARSTLFDDEMRTAVQSVSRLKETSA
jgi:alpha-methylacyl-CoA racemase